MYDILSKWLESEPSLSDIYIKNKRDYFHAEISKKCICVKFAWEWNEETPFIWFWCWV